MQETHDSEVHFFVLIFFHKDFSSRIGIDCNYFICFISGDRWIWTSSLFSAAVHDINVVSPSNQEKNIRKIYVHPDYSSPCDKYHDIALLKVDGFAISQYVKPICVGTAPPVVGTECLTSGWGKTGTIFFLLIFVHTKQRTNVRDHSHNTHHK